MDSLQVVREYYNADVAAEWERLAKHPFEFEITTRMMTKTIRPGDRVLDIGGGPGRYSLFLSKLGCDVTLLDLSENNVDFALQKAKEEGLPLQGLAGDARHADELLARHDFDHVLMMGPLYHLLEENDRRQAAQAALRCLKPGGMLYAAFIMMFSGMIYMMKYMPEQILAETEQRFIDQVLVNGTYSGNAFTIAHFSNLAEIERFFAPYPLTRRALFGQEGILSPCEEHFLAATPEVRERWIEHAVALCERPELLSWSEHVMYIGQKQ